MNRDLKIFSLVYPRVGRQDRELGSANVLIWTPKSGEFAISEIPLQIGVWIVNQESQGAKMGSSTFLGGSQPSFRLL